MIKKYLAPVLGIMSFVSFVTYATAQTKNLPQSPIVEEINKQESEPPPVIESIDNVVQSPEVASANITIDKVETSEVLNRSQSNNSQAPVTLPVTPTIAAVVEQPIISPILLTDEQSDDEYASDDGKYEDSGYEEEDAEDDD